METNQLEFPKEKEEAQKILFTGLDSAGKTSIILALQREISQIAVLKPTRQAQRKIFEYLGRQIAEWDLGGQQRYRIAYLKQPNKYFDRTSVCIYVIDIQDKDRLGEALSYFADVIKQFRTLKIAPLIFIFFHKMDPDFLKENHQRIDGVISDIKDKIAKVVNNEFNVSFFRTTIYDLWSIISAFSQILLQLYPQSELVDKTVQEFGEKMETEGMIILDANFLIIAQYYTSDRVKEILSQITPYFLTLNDSFVGADEQVDKMVIERGGYGFYFNQFGIEKVHTPFFILIMKSTIQFPEDDIDSFIKLFKPLV